MVEWDVIMNYPIQFVQNASHATVSHVLTEQVRLASFLVDRVIFCGTK